MPTVEESINIRAPIETVFTAVTDPERGPEWNSNIIEVSGVSYPLREGSTWNQTARVAGRRMRLTCRVTRLEPPRYGELDVSGDQKARIWTRCDDMGDYVQVTQGTEFVPPGGMLGVVLGGVASTMIRQEITHSLERQRATLEVENGAMRESGA